jgi:hypothetical protein
LARTIDAGALSLGVGALVTTAGGLWKRARLRSDLIAEFQGRMALAQAALDERAASDLRSLAERVNRVLGDLETFDPHQALADPAELQAHVDHVGRVLTARKCLPRCFRRMLAIGPLLTILLPLLIASIATALTYFSGWLRNRAVGYGGVWAGAILLLCCAATAAYYFLQLHLFSRAEVLALPGTDHE